MAEQQNILDRYTAGARLNHWINAILMICLALSGMALFHPSLFFLSDLSGGGVWTRILHPWMGLLALLSFLGLFIRFWKFNLWTRDDSAWMKNVKHVVAGDEAKVPEAGKYNAGQKLVFWFMCGLIILLLMSGLALWDSQFGHLTSIEQKRLAAVVHALSAVVLIAVVITHIYAAIWIRGMTRGSVTGGWAWRHHRKWLREEVGKSK
ncbi:MAG TPA: formate dehydrogenase subunit gamma [Vineibacter sp.]|nr:formate dehydrogenase subunit gamma [Vineibacter sp.]